GDAGVDLDRRGGVQVHPDLDVGLARGAAKLADACGGQQLAGDAGPVEIVVADAQPAQAHVFGELEVGFAVADDRRAAAVEFGIAQVVEQHADAGLARGRVVFGPGRVDVNGVECNALGF